MTRQYFTVAEVNAILPQVSAAAEKVRHGASRLAELHGILHGGERPEPDTVVHTEYLAVMQVVIQGMEAIDRLGGQVKDLSMGLVDFPSLFQGREVLLCWRPGEDRVGYWHDLRTGFAGRSAIEDETQFHGDADPET